MSSGASTQYEYDTNGWISRLRHFDAVNALISDTSYVRDRMGNILNQAVSVGSSTNASTMLTAGTTTYTYDSGTNRLANIRIGSMSGAIDSTFTHDFEGRLTNQTGVGAKTLSWDSRNRVSSIAMPNTTTATMSYDAADQRTGKSDGAQGGYLTMSLKGSYVEAVYGGGGTLTEKYLRGSTTDELVAGFILEGQTKPIPKLYHQDHIGSVSAITDHKGGVTQSFTYSAFGQMQRAAGGGIARLKYTGRDDDETGLYYYRARYYDPRIGRFISEDPMGYGAGDVNFYAYVGNNPVNGNDPSGLVDWRGLGKATIDIFANGAGLVTGGILTLGGAALMVAPEPTISKLTGGITFTTGITNIANSTPGLYNAGRNFIRAIQDNPNAPANLPTSGSTILANTMFPGNQAAQDVATIADLSLALASGRVPVGTSQINSFSALSQRAPVSINGMLDARAVAVPRSMSGVILPSADSASSVASRALDATQFGQLFSIGFDKALPIDGGSPAAGGFLLYPNKSNVNQMQSVYSK
jgi:RHS repeat-associated protein